ncbi:MAG: hypothetical protein EON98_12670 [Chitinophagaceae bacterium]|nr:MAG: hypothetical protein EON98_12670 [Chitinophagaceae bacterium]
MKFFLLLLISLFLQTDQRKKITVVQKGWLVYRYGDNLAFLPIKNQAVTPTYENFFTEEKGHGQRMNNSYSAPPKLLIARELTVGIYNYDSKMQKDTFAGRTKFYIQPVKHVYETEDLKADTADYGHGVMSWTFQIKGKPVQHTFFYFMNRSGTIYFLNKQESLFAAKGGRRRNIEIYPPH